MLSFIKFVNFFMLKNIIAMYFTAIYYNITKNQLYVRLTYSQNTCYRSNGFDLVTATSSNYLIRIVVCRNNFDLIFFTKLPRGNLFTVLAGSIRSNNVQLQRQRNRQISQLQTTSSQFLFFLQIQPSTTDDFQHPKHKCVC